FVLGAEPAVADLPSWLPRYDLDIHLDVDQHRVQVCQRVTWTNRHQRPAHELVFNAHSHYKIPDGRIGFMAKTVEILRMSPTDAIDGGPPPLAVQTITLGGKQLDSYYQQPIHITEGDKPPPDDPETAKRYQRRLQEETDTALVVPLPSPVRPGESVTVEI